MRKHQAFYLALPTVLALLVLFIAPMVYILVGTLRTDGLQYYQKFLTDSFYLNILWTTVKISLQTTLICLLLGYPAAYFLARTKSRIKNLLIIMTVFPFLVSAVVRSYGWMVILGKNGLLNQLLRALGLIEKPLSILYTPTAVLIGLVHLLTPYMILGITSVIQSIDRNVEYAAHSLGASPFKTFLKVTLPLSSPGIISGCILVFTLSMTSYVTPKLLGGTKFRMMSTMVFQEVNVNFNWGFASAISYILLFVILVILLVSNFAADRYTRRLGGGKNA
ncbi:ABC transporter permease subunit [Beduinella massiliensis]|uniref:ABC transporter permease subunit n=1 Tax=Beduinella massiliensis TaxID=1852363 RepID=UPI000C81D378